jgi:ubiquinone/menaquinone biosynthesis C-methylase UbiE
MTKKTDKQQYAKTTFNEIASGYDKIEFFKISAKYVSSLIISRKGKNKLDILDVACGTGNVVLESALLLESASFDALDISKSMIDIAKKNATIKNINNINFIEEDISNYTETKRYDVITCSYALFFFPDLIETFKKLKRVLKNNGIIIFTSFTKKAFLPSTNILLSLLKKYGSSSAIEYEPDKWENLKTLKDIQYLCKQAQVGFTLETINISCWLDIDSFWELLNNTGFKGMLLELNKTDYKFVKQEYYKEMSKYLNQDNRLELIADSNCVVVEIE